MDVTVVGGGIAGLAAARALALDGATVRVLEASDRRGGRIGTDVVDGRPLERGPDAFLARSPHAAGLARAVGLGDQLVAPATGRAFVWTGGALRALPPGLVLGVPATFGPLRRSGILSPLEWARAAMEPLLPGAPAREDRSVGSLLSARYGRAVADRLVDPLLGGINAGDSHRLSLEAGAVQLWPVAATSRSIALGLRAQQRKAPPSDLPVFWTVAGGLASLVDAVADDLRGRGVAIELSSPVGSLGDVTGPVVLAAPASETAAMLHDVAPEAASVAQSIEYASVVLVTLVLPRDAFPAGFDGSGFLVPRVERRLLTACTVVTSKWSHLDTGADVVVRLSAGKRGDTRAMDLDDDELVRRLRIELALATGVRADPMWVRVVRHPDSFPQYDVGHVARVARLRGALPEGVAVAGAAYDGVGIPACIASGERAARDVVRCGSRR